MEQDIASTKSELARLEASMHRTARIGRRLALATGVLAARAGVYAAATSQWTWAEVDAALVVINGVLYVGFWEGRAS